MNSVSSARLQLTPGFGPAIKKLVSLWYFSQSFSPLGVWCNAPGPTFLLEKKRGETKRRQCCGWSSGSSWFLSVPRGAWVAINARQTQWASAAGRSGPCAGNLRAKRWANYQISFDGNAGNKQDALMIVDGGLHIFILSFSRSLFLCDFKPTSCTSGLFSQNTFKIKLYVY